MKRVQFRIPGIVGTILKRIQGAGFEAYVVGGAVRDMVMGRTPSDWDIVTSASAEKVEDLFPHLTRFSLQHGTITLVSEGKHYEVSAFRGPSPTIEDDLAHRDFTVNAMAWEPDKGRLIDPWGGTRDVKRRLVRAVGAPEDRFREDPLRILRAVRIACELHFRIEGKTRDTLSTMALSLAGVAGERVRDEVTRILLSERPSRGLRDLVRTGLLDQIAPELVEGRRKGRKMVHRGFLETVDRVDPDPVLRLAALFHRVGEDKKEQEKQSAGITEVVMGRLKFSKRMISDVTHLVMHHGDVIHYDPSWDDGAVRRLVRRVGLERLDHFFSLCRAVLESQGKDTGLLSDLEERVRSNLKAGFPCRVQNLKVDGRKVMEVLGLPEGPEVGGMLKALLEEVLDHPEWNTEEKLIERLKEINRDWGRKCQP
jgi:tRNA nucleotidyltransferase/poly(A) polymerase